MKTFKKYPVAIFTALILLSSGLSQTAQASIISENQIQEQQRIVMVSIVELLQEDLKLIQMQLIQKLEARVNYLNSLK